MRRALNATLVRARSGEKVWGQAAGDGSSIATVLRKVLAGPYRRCQVLRAA